LVSSSIPVVALSVSSPYLSYVTSILGVAIVISEGLLHLNQYHHNWIAYRNTCESLRHEKYLYSAMAGPYSFGNAEVLLAERIESIISHENAKWVSVQRNVALNSKKIADQ
ncbi:MAG: DUF4231 domain-containing protein, partial [Nitrospinota bacterium]|nr:DUF4231 domain-containing protein [Nitrospinota bacterium]